MRKHVSRRVEQTSKNGQETFKWRDGEQEGGEDPIKMPTTRQGSKLVVDKQKNGAPRRKPT